MNFNWGLNLIAFSLSPIFFHRLTNSRGRSVVDSGFEQLLSERGYVKNVSSAVSRVTKRCSGCLGNPTPTEAALEPA